MIKKLIVFAGIIALLAFVVAYLLEVITHQSLSFIQQIEAPVHDPHVQDQKQAPSPHVNSGISCQINDDCSLYDKQMETETFCCKYSYCEDLYQDYIIAVNKNWLLAKRQQQCNANIVCSPHPEYMCMEQTYESMKHVQAECIDGTCQKVIIK